VGPTLVRQYLREVRRQRQEVYIPLIHRAGEQAQVDFFEVTVEVGGQRLKAWEFLPAPVGPTPAISSPTATASRAAQEPAPTGSSATIVKRPRRARR